LQHSKLTFEEAWEILKSNNYDEKKVRNFFVDDCISNIHRYLQDIDKIKKLKEKNRKMEEICEQLSNLSNTENVEKVIRYEKALQKSIIQNLILLKRMQTNGFVL
jgi:hypothetical protein